MHTLNDIKNEFIDHLYGIDKSKLSVLDLRTYAEIVKLLDEIERSNKPSKWEEMLSTMSAGGFGMQYKPAEMKEV